MLGSIFKKFVDFNGNKIKNARVDMPTHNEDLVPKKYVDDRDIYATDSVKKHKIPFLFKWMGDVNNLSTQQIFDKLFFGDKILPEFIDGELNYCKIQLKKYTNIYNTLVDNDDVMLKYDITLNDRSKVISKRIISKFSDKNDMIVAINDGKLNGEININLADQTQIILEVIYAPFKVKKGYKGTDVTPENNGNKTEQYIVFEKHKTLPINLGNFKTLPTKMMYSSNTKTINSGLIDKFKTANKISDLVGFNPLNDSFNHNVSKVGYYLKNNIIIMVEKNYYEMITANLKGINTDTFNQYIELNKLDIITEKTIDDIDYLLLNLELTTKENRTLFLTKI